MGDSNVPQAPGISHEFSMSEVRRPACFAAVINTGIDGNFLHGSSGEGTGVEATQHRETKKSGEGRQARENHSPGSEKKTGRRGVGWISTRLGGGLSGKGKSRKEKKKRKKGIHPWGTRELFAHDRCYKTLRDGRSCCTIGTEKAVGPTTRTR